MRTTRSSTAAAAASSHAPVGDTLGSTSASPPAKRENDSEKPKKRQAPISSAWKQSKPGKSGSACARENHHTPIGTRKSRTTPSDEGTLGISDHVEKVSKPKRSRTQGSSPSNRNRAASALGRAPSSGSIQTDQSGKPLRTIANLGLPRGARSSCGHQGLLAPIAIRVLMDVQPLLSHQTITQAMDELAQGGDLQRAKNLLKHDDVTTVRALIRHWHEVWGMEVPALYTGEDVSTLSTAALDRATRRLNNAIYVPLVVEEGGVMERDGEEVPVLPAELVGQRFANGKELGAAIQKVVADIQQRLQRKPEEEEGQQGATATSKKLPGAVTAALTVAGTFAMQVDVDATWVTLPALQTTLEACDISPLATLRVDVKDRRPGETQGRRSKGRAAAKGADEAVLCRPRHVEAQLCPYAPPQEQQQGSVKSSPDESERLYRLVTGRWAALPKTATSPASAATILLSAPASLVQPGGAADMATGGSQRIIRHHAEALADGNRELPPTKLQHGKASMLKVPSRESRQLLAPASLLQKALRRGRALSDSQAPALEAIRALLHSESCTVSSDLGHQRCSGTRMLLWRLFVSAIEDSCPFSDPGPQGGRRDVCAAPLSVSALLALALMAHVDGSFRLPPWLKEQVIETALSLQAHDNAGAQWPWRGWRRYEKAAAEALSRPECVPGPVPRLRDALRCALLVGPLSSSEALVARRLLGAALEASSSLEKRLRPLPAAPPADGSPSPSPDAASVSPITPLSSRQSPRGAAAPARKDKDEAPPDETSQIRRLDAQQTLAALDPDVFPNMLLLVQACMPMPPADPGQHSLRALSDLVGRLSSGVNSRTLQQQAGGGPAQELFRIQQFTEGEGGDPFLGLAEDAPGGDEGPGWHSIEDALKLTPHEVELLRVIESVQSHLAEQLGGVWEASSRALLPHRGAMKNTHTSTASEGDGEEEEEVEVVGSDAARKGVLGNDDSAGSPRQPLKRRRPRREHHHGPPYESSEPSSELPGPAEAAIKLEPSGRGPTPHEARTAFLQLFGSRQVFPVKWMDAKGKTRESTVAVTIAGTAEDPFLVQRVGDATDVAGDAAADPEEQDDEAAAAEGEEDEEDGGGGSGSKGGSPAAADNKGAVPHMYRYLGPGPLKHAAVSSLMQRMQHGMSAALPAPPPGFLWPWPGAPSTATVRVVIRNDNNEQQTEAKTVRPRRGTKRRNHQDTSNSGDDAASAPPSSASAAVEFYANDTLLPAFDATGVLVACNRPSQVSPLSPRQRSVLSEALYVGAAPPGSASPPSPPSPTGQYSADPIQLLADMDEMARELRSGQEAQLPASGGHVPDWLPLAQRSALKGGVWRDLAIKVATREGSVLEVSPVQADGNRRSSAVVQMTEGTVLRLLYVLQMLYPLCLRRISDLRFRVDGRGGQYHHLRASLDLLAFGPDRLSPGAGTLSVCPKIEGSSMAAPPPIQRPQCPRVSTALWPHQQEAADRVMGGILAGKRGFADASSVGSGKTLTAIATVARAAQWLESRGTTRHGALVMVPTSDLVEEWVQQAKLHTCGFKVVVQLASGQLHDRGTTGSAAGMVSGARGRRGAVDSNTIVVTTLARARDRPFTAQAGWDLVVIDECLSVQNDTAMQTMEAWRHVEASRCGVLMLSATFFRSRYSKLFYMVRMLRSALPRIEPFLNVTLCEHIICYIPQGRRKWKLEYNPVPLPAKAQKGYENRILDFVRAASASGSGRDHRIIWTELKAFLRFHFEEDVLIEAFCAETSRLQAAGRRPLLFANTDHEADLLLRRVPGARRLSQSRGSKDDASAPSSKPGAQRALRAAIKGKAKPSEGPLVVTVHRGSHGLNLQGEADAIVCRPQPGDIIEQIKGRVDRPGQRESELHLVVLFAKDTVEEAEAANIRLCGAFFRQYLDPLSRTFQQLAVEASVTASSNAAARLPRSTQKKDRCVGGVATAFRKQLQEVTSFKEEEAGGDEAGEGAAQAAATMTATTPRMRRRSAAHDEEEDRMKPPPDEAAGSLPAADGTPKNKRAKHSETSNSRGSGKKAASSSRGSGKSAAEGKGGKDKGPRRPPLSINLGSFKEPASEKERSEQHVKRAKKAAEGGYDAGPARILTAGEVDKALTHLRAADSKLARVISQIGPPTGLVSRFGGDPFPSMTKSIIYQQLSTKAAACIFGRFEAKCKAALGDDGTGVTPEAVLKLDVEALRGCGLSAKKVEYVQLLAGEFQAGRLSAKHFAKASDAEVLALLCGCKGFGEWSANMFMMFNLGRADVLPVGDLAVRKAFKRLYGCRYAAEHDTAVADHVDLPDRQEMEEIAAAWKPYRTVGSWYMWHVVETAEAAYTYGGAK